MAQTMTLDQLNAMDKTAFVAAIGEAFEHADWIAAGAFGSAPFATIKALHDAMLATLQSAAPATQLAFINGHPELGSKVAQIGDLTDASKFEQGGLGLDRLSPAEFARFEQLNSRYREKFGFPFVVCVRRHTRDSILRQFARRLENTPEIERAAALAEIGLITRLRLVGMVSGPGAPITHGRLSTHVLDAVRGCPAPLVRVELFEIGASATGLLRETQTNDDGRTDVPLMSGAPLRIGTYELRFHIGAYFSSFGATMSDPPFLDCVPIRFSIAEPEGHYHVPLLATPWSFSTYRGS